VGHVTSFLYRPSLSMSISNTYHTISLLLIPFDPCLRPLSSRSNPEQDGGHAKSPASSGGSTCYAQSCCMLRRRPGFERFKTDKLQLLQAAKILMDPECHNAKQTGLSKMRITKIVTVANQRFHDALDEIEVDIVSTR